MYLCLLDLGIDSTLQTVDGDTAIDIVFAPRVDLGAYLCTIRVSLVETLCKEYVGFGPEERLEHERDIIKALLDK
jgi:hypothetical protein